MSEMSEISRDEDLEIDEEEAQASLAHPASLQSVYSCPSCGRARLNQARCAHCGDRLSDTSGLSPYERLGLLPRPIYSQLEVRRAERRILNEFHILKTPRHLSHWSLKQRALVTRDASTLRSMSGSLCAYLKLYIERERLILQSEHLWVMSPMELVAHLKRAISTGGDEPRDSGGLTLSDPPLSDPLTHVSAFSSSPSLYVERVVIESSYAELHEYDGYQERSALMVESARRLRDRVERLAEELTALTISQQEHTQLLSSTVVLMRQIEEVRQVESWLDARSRVRKVFK